MGRGELFADPGMGRQETNRPTTNGYVRLGCTGKGAGRTEYETERSVLHPLSLNGTTHLCSEGRRLVLCEGESLSRCVVEPPQRESLSGGRGVKDRGDTTDGARRVLGSRAGGTSGRSGPEDEVSLRESTTSHSVEIFTPVPSLKLPFPPSTELTRKATRRRNVEGTRPSSQSSGQGAPVYT